MQIPVKNASGEVVDQIEVSDAVFGVPINTGLLHQAVVRQLANLRQGTHDTKTRGQVNGTTRKMFKQKGTGNSRQSTKKVPHWRGGGVVFGPHPRSYRQGMPKRMRRAALRCALSTKAGEGALIILDQLAFEEPETRAMIALLKSLAVERSALIITPESTPNVYLSARNIPGIDTLPAATLNTLDVMRHDFLVMPIDALRRVEASLIRDRVRGEPLELDNTESIEDSSSPAVDSDEKSSSKDRRAAETGATGDSDAASTSAEDRATTSESDELSSAEVTSEPAKPARRTKKRDEASE